MRPLLLIDRDRIQASQAKDVVELLRFEAGLDVGRNGGYGSTTSLFIRGANSNQTLVLVDGVKINPGTIGGAAIQNIHPSHIDRIEIVKGPRSSLYGSEAIGGVVHIFTRRASAANQLTLDIGGGSDNTRDLALAYHHKVGAFRHGFSLSHFSTDGYETKKNGGEDRGFESTSGQFYVGWQGASTDIEFSHWQVDGKVEYFDFFLNAVDQDAANSVSSLKIKQQLSSMAVVNANFSHVIDDVDQNQSDDFAHTERNGVDLNVDLTISPQDQLIVGAQVSKENVRALSFFSHLAPDKQPTTRMREGYVQYLWQRADFNGVVAFRHSDHEDFGHYLTREYSLGYAINEQAKAYIAYATGFRAADNSSRFGFGGNPDLDPERAKNIELGLDINTSDNATMGLRLFNSRIDDLIVYNGSINLNQNIDKVTVRGAEFDYTVDLPTWSWDLSLVVQDPFNRATGEQLARRARRSLSNTIRYKLPRGNIGLQWLLSDTRPDSDFSDTINAGYGLLNLIGQWSLSHELTLKARIENATDRDYVLADGFISQPRTVLFQLSYALN